MTGKFDEPMLDHFDADNRIYLRDDLRELEAAYADMATLVVRLLIRDPERTVALRKLLESRDCAMRTPKRMTPVKP
jgi:hypothetical protein